MSPSSADDTSGVSGSLEMTPSMLNMIRLALLAGSLLFGAIAWFLTSSGQFEPAMDERVASMLRYIFYGLVTAHLIGIALVRQRADHAESFTQQARLLIVGYALAEGLVLFGAVYLLMTGSAMLFLGGLLVFVIAFIVLPVQSAPAH